MKTKQSENGITYIFSEKDVKVAIIEYIENSNANELEEFKTYNFVGDELHIISSSVKPLTIVEKKKINKLSHKKRKKFKH